MTNTHAWPPPHVQSDPQDKAPGSIALGALSMRLNVLWTLSGNGVYAACQWGMLIVLAKLGGPGMVGEFALALAVTAPILMLTNLHLRVIQATDARREFAFSQYLGLRLVTTIIAAIAIGGAIVVGGHGGEAALVIALVGLAKIFESLSDAFYGFLQQSERMDRIAMSLILKGTLSLCVLGGIVLITGNLVAAVAGLALVWGALLALYDLPNAAGVMAGREAGTDSNGKHDHGGHKLLHPDFNFSRLRQLTILALPLGLVLAINSLTTNVPRYFIQHSDGSISLGFFAAIAYLMVAGNTVIIAVADATSPRLAKHYAAGNLAEFRNLLMKLLLMACGLGAIGIAASWLAGSWILSVLYRPEYGLHADIFRILMIAATLYYLIAFLGTAVTAARYFKIQAPLSVATLGISLVGSALLIPWHGLVGAALAVLAAAAFQVTAYAVITAHALRPRWSGARAAPVS